MKRAEQRKTPPAAATPAAPAPASHGESVPRKVYLIDGSGFIFRAFHALPPLSRPDGKPVGAVLGFVNMLLRLMGGRDSDHIAVVFDKSEQTFRKELYVDYKAHRPDPPPEIIPQFPL